MMNIESNLTQPEPEPPPYPQQYDQPTYSSQNISSIYIAGIILQHNHPDVEITQRTSYIIYDNVNPIILGSTNIDNSDIMFDNEFDLEQNNNLDIKLSTIDVMNEEQNSNFDYDIIIVSSKIGLCRFCSCGTICCLTLSLLSIIIIILAPLHQLDKK